MKGKKSSKGKPFMGAVWGVLMVMFLAEALVYTWCRVQYVRAGYEITEATKENQGMVELHRKLKVEEARLRSPKRIMQIAEERGLVMPESRQVVVVP
jgi:cell division protein FtsL